LSQKYCKSLQKSPFSGKIDCKLLQNQQLSPIFSVKTLTKYPKFTTPMRPSAVKSADFLCKSLQNTAKTAISARF